MTTVAVAGLVMAADTKFTIGDGFYQSNKMERIGDWIVSTAAMLVREMNSMTGSVRVSLVDDHEFQKILKRFFYAATALSITCSAMIACGAFAKPITPSALVATTRLEHLLSKNGLGGRSTPSLPSTSQADANSAPAEK